MYTNNNEETLH